jgi:hypothetical protein
LKYVGLLIKKKGRGRKSAAEKAKKQQKEKYVRNIKKILADLVSIFKY